MGAALTSINSWLISQRNSALGLKILLFVLGMAQLVFAGWHLLPTWQDKQHLNAESTRLASEIATINPQIDSLAAEVAQTTTAIPSNTDKTTTDTPWLAFLVQRAHVHHLNVRQVELMAEKKETSAQLVRLQLAGTYQALSLWQEEITADQRLQGINELSILSEAQDASDPMLNMTIELEGFKR